MSVQESSLHAARETILKFRSLVASMSVPAPAPAPRLKGYQPMRQTGIDSRWEKSLPPLPREGANRPDILDMIHRGLEEAGLMNPNSRRRSTGAWRNPRDGSQPPLRRQKTTIGAESRKSWIEHDKSDLSLLDVAVSLRSPKAEGWRGEEYRWGGRCGPLCGRG